MRPRTAAPAALAVACALLCACHPESEPKPDFEWRGQWIDILGLDTIPDQTCAGTFVYLDDFAGSTAREFGVTDHLGVYRWYSSARFEADDPCTGAAAACTGSNGVFSRVMPLEHEVVHLVNDHVVACPSVIAEGLAEYYGMTSQTPTTGDIVDLIAKSEKGRIDFDDYPLAGAFVAHLVEVHGIGPVLDLCERSGVYPSMERFAEATQTALGTSLEQVLMNFAGFDCTFAEYRSKHFECGGEPDLFAGTEPVEFEFIVDCESQGTIGPRQQEIWNLGLVRVQEPGIYLAELNSSSGSHEGVRVVLTQCAGCYDSPRIHTLVDDGTNGTAPIQLEASDYMVEVFGSTSFADVVTLRLTLL